MPPRQAGFSLIEALISLLVLSIGLLGLGQLQARLSVASLNRASAAYARLIQTNLYEKTISYRLSEIPGSEPVSTPSGLYTIQLFQSTEERLTTTGIRIEWIDLDRDRNETINSILSTYPTPSDTRWLMGSAAAPVCPC